MLLWALLPFNPYSYYEVLRWTVFLYFMFLASTFRECGEKKMFWLLVAVCLVYNPFIRPSLGRTIWSVVNVLTLVPLGMSVPLLWKNCCDCVPDEETAEAEQDGAQQPAARRKSKSGG